MKYTTRAYKAIFFLIVVGLLVHFGFYKYKIYKNSICRVQKEISFYRINCDIFNFSNAIKKINPNILLINKNQSAKFSAVYEAHSNINVILNNGFLITLDINAKKILSIRKLDLENLDDSSFGGLVSAINIPEKNILVTYSLNSNIEKNKKFLYLTVFDNNTFHQIKQYQLTHDDTLPAALGGGMAADTNFLYLSIGTATPGFTDFLSNRAQDRTSIYGKIIQISLRDFHIDNKLGFRIFSVGHKHSQGLLKTSNDLLEVEHSIEDGDELNDIKFGKNYGYNNFGYTKESKPDQTYNYLNRRSEDYKDPLYFFTPEIAPSDIAECPFNENLVGYAYNPCVLIASLKQKSIYIAKFKRAKLSSEVPKNPVVLNVEKLEIKERVRKIFSKRNTNKILVFTDRLTIYSLKFIEK